MKPGKTKIIVSTPSQNFIWFQKFQINFVKNVLVTCLQEIIKIKLGSAPSSRTSKEPTNKILPWCIRTVIQIVKCDEQKTTASSIQLKKPLVSTPTSACFGVWSATLLNNLTHARSSKRETYRLNLRIYTKLVNRIRNTWNGFAFHQIYSYFCIKPTAWVGCGVLLAMVANLALSAMLAWLEILLWVDSHPPAALWSRNTYALRRPWTQNM